MADAIITAGTLYGGSPSKPLFMRKVSITGPSSYSTGGVTFDPADYLEHGTMIGSPIHLPDSAAPTYHPFYNSGTGKVLFIVSATGLECAAQVDLDAVTMDMLLIGA